MRKGALHACFQVGTAFRAGEAKVAEESKESETSETSNAKQQTQQSWTPEELARLKKGLGKFPVGTRSRWEAIAEYVGRSADEVGYTVYQFVFRVRILVYQLMNETNSMSLLAMEWLLYCSFSTASATVI